MSLIIDLAKIMAALHIRTIMPDIPMAKRDPYSHHHGGHKGDRNRRPRNHGAKRQGYR
jgi:hypothetical protein